MREKWEFKENRKKENEGRNWKVRECVTVVTGIYNEEKVKKLPESESGNRTVLD